MIDDLKPEVSSEYIAELIVDLPISQKTESNDANVCNIVLRTGNSLLKKKGSEVNSHLKEFCKERNLYLIGNTK